MATKKTIQIYDFSFKPSGWGHYKVTYTSPKTGKQWTATVNDMTLIDATKNADNPKVIDLNRLKAKCKSNKALNGLSKKKGSTKTAKRKTKAKGVGSTKTAKRKTKTKGVGSTKTATPSKHKYPRSFKCVIDGKNHSVKITRDLRDKHQPFKVENTQNWTNWLNLKRFAANQETAANKYFEKVVAKFKKEVAKKKVQKKTLSGSKYHRVSKPVGGVMNSRKQRQLVQLGSMKPAQRFMFPNGKAAYTFKGFTKANAAKYESERGGTYESQNLKINVVLI